jgi:hypothetical protein
MNKNGFVKVRNRHGFVTMHAGFSILGAESALSRNAWTVCARDADGEEWAWARLATPAEAQQWLAQGNNLGEWVEA